MLSQSTVSHLMRALEDELGVQLFERRHPRVTPTLAGEALYRHAMPLVYGMDRLPDTLAEEHFGVVSSTLTIGAGQTSAAYLLPRYLAQFRQRYPEVRVRVRTGGGSQRLRWLRAYQVDLILLAVDKPPRDLQFHELAVSRYMLVTPLDHPLAESTSLDLPDLDGYRFVGHVSGQRVRQIGDSIMRQHDVEPDFAVEIDGWSIIKLYVAAGLGISAVPEICITENDAVWSAPLDRYLPIRRYGAVTRDDGLLPLAAQRFLEIIVEDAQRRADARGAN